MLAGIGVGVLMRYWGLVNLTMPCLATLAARDGPRNAALSVGSDDDSARGTVRGERLDWWLAWRAETSWTPSYLAMGEQVSDVAHAAILWLASRKLHRLGLPHVLLGGVGKQAKRQRESRPNKSRHARGAQSARGHDEW